MSLLDGYAAREAVSLPMSRATSTRFAGTTSFTESCDHISTRPSWRIRMGSARLSCWSCEPSPESIPDSLRASCMIPTLSSMHLRGSLGLTTHVRLGLTLLSLNVHDSRSRSSEPSRACCGVLKTSCVPVRIRLKRLRSSSRLPCANCSRAACGASRRRRPRSGRCRRVGVLRLFRLRCNVLTMASQQAQSTNLSALNSCELRTFRMVQWIGVRSRTAQLITRRLNRSASQTAISSLLGLELLQGRLSSLKMRQRQCLRHT